MGQHVQLRSMAGKLFIMCNHIACLYVPDRDILRSITFLSARFVHMSLIKWGHHMGCLECRRGSWHL